MAFKDAVSQSSKLLSQFVCNSENSWNKLSLPPLWVFISGGHRRYNGKTLSFSKKNVTAVNSCRHLNSDAVELMVMRSLYKLGSKWRRHSKSNKQIDNFVMKKMDARKKKHIFDSRERLLLSILAFLPTNDKLSYPLLCFFISWSHRQIALEKLFS